MRGALAIFALAVLAIAGFGYFTPRSVAQAPQAGMAAEGPEVQIPSGAKFITQVHFTTNSPFPNYVKIPGVITVSNGSSSRWVVIRFSSDAYSLDSGTNRSDARVAVDGGVCQIAGPELFNHCSFQGFAGCIQARTWQGVVFTGPGNHTYQMCGAVEGGGSQTWGFRDLTGESRSN
jgi:hypothetical protein